MIRFTKVSAVTSITILVDNRAGEGLASEHGLSFWIETNGRRIMYDTGQGGALETNAAVLGIDLSRTDTLVLSHGHYDHTGGIPQVLRQVRATEIYCHPGIMQPRYAVRDGKAKAIGIPELSRVTLDSWTPHRVHWVEKELMLSDKIGITGPIPRLTSYEDTGGPFFHDPEGRRADSIEDDLALWIKTDHGVVVCIGCAHAGLVNTLDYVRRLAEGERIHAVVGGFHLVDADQNRLDRTIDALLSLGPDLVVPCHCTGEAAYRALAEAFGERMSAGAAGMILRF